MDTATESVGRAAYGIKMKEIVGFGEEAGLTIFAPPRDMLGYARQRKSRFPRHRRP